MAVLETQNSAFEKRLTGHLLRAQLQGPSSWIDLERRSTGESVERVLEVEQAVAALTDHQGFPINCEFTGRSYRSHDFRDHPDLESNLAILRSNWNDPEHPSFRTMQLLEELVGYRHALGLSAADKSARGQTLHEDDLTCETVWRRIHGVDVFSAGIVHQPEYYERHREHYRRLSQHAGAIVIEGHQTNRTGDSIQIEWALRHEPHMVFGKLMEDAASIRPDIFFFDIDPRNDSHVRYDELEAGSRTLPPKFLRAFYDHIIASDPHLGEKLACPDELHQLLCHHCQENLGKTASHNVLLRNGIQYSPFPYLDCKDGRFSRSEVPTGLEFGSLLFADAATAYLLQRIAQTIKKGGILNIRGPILDIQGNGHIANKKRYMDSPADAMRMIALHPHLAYLPETPPAEEQPTPAENAGNILRHLDTGVFRMDPFGSPDVPQGLYASIGGLACRINAERNIEFI